MVARVEQCCWMGSSGIWRNKADEVFACFCRGADFPRHFRAWGGKITEQSGTWNYGASVNPVKQT
jgi:hypothetical protein